MTISARTTFTAPKRKTIITATVGSAKLIADITDGGPLFTVRGPVMQFKINHNDEIDALIELLHAIKSSAETVDEPHFDIIAVDEPTA